MTTGSLMKVKRIAELEHKAIISLEKHFLVFLRVDVFLIFAPLLTFTVSEAYKIVLLFNSPLSLANFIFLFNFQALWALKFFSRIL